MTDEQRADELIEKAEKGNVAAMGLLAIKRYFGDSVGKSVYIKRDKRKAIEYMNKAAAMGDANALYLRGYIYEHGDSELGLRTDYDFAMSNYYEAAMKGHNSARAAYVGCAIEHYDKDETYMRRAYNFMVQAAKEGDGLAMAHLAVAYKNGHFGLKKNVSEYIYWLDKSARAKMLGVGSQVIIEKMEYVGSQVMLGDTYNDGKLVKRDCKKAVKYYQMAANADDKDGQHRLGMCYYHGDGVEQDYEKAFELLLKAAEQGQTKAMGSVAVAYLKGWGVAVDYDKGYYWAKAAVDSGEMKACATLAYCYEHGYGVAKDIKTANYWKRKGEK